MPPDSGASSVGSRRSRLPTGMRSITTGHPFLKHAFLDALEATGCVGDESGWLPAHLVVRDEQSGRLVAAVPQYLKAHSWGEFVFDWSWAQAYQRAGLEYYPKLLSAIPFTPVTGPRLLVATAPPADADAGTMREELAGLLQEVARRSQALGRARQLHATRATRPRSSARASCAGTIAASSGATAGYRDLRRLPRDVPRRQAQEGEARTAAHRRSRHRVPHVARRGNRARAVASRLRVFRAHVPAARQRPLPQRRLPACAWRRHCRARSWSSSPSVTAWRSPPRSSSRAGTGCTAATGVPRNARIRCTSRPATTRASTTASSTACWRFDPGTQGEHKIARGFEPTRTLSAHWLAARRVRECDRAATSSASVAPSTTTSPRRASTCPFTTAQERRRPRRAATHVIHWLQPDGSAGRVPAGERGAGRSPTACSAPAATCRPRGCSPPTGAASSPGTRPASRSSGGHPIRAACCCPREFTCRAASPRRCAPWLSRHLRHALRGGRGTLRRHRRARARGHLDLARDARGLRRTARLGYAHSVETWRGERSRRRALRRALGRVFFGESMFSTARDASKVALHRLAQVVACARNVAVDRLPGREPPPGAPRRAANAARRVPGAPRGRHQGRCARAPRGRQRAADRVARAGGAGIHCIAGGLYAEFARLSGRCEGAWRRKMRFRWKGSVRRDAAQYDVSRAVAERPRRDRAHLRQDAQELHPHSHRRQLSRWK